MRICKHCGLPESDHHEFESTLTMPVGCVCDAGTWDGAAFIPRVCENYVGTGVSYCENCEHDKACHATSPEESE